MIKITGHTDGLGREKQNKTLSVARSQAVKDYLIQAGLHEEMLAKKDFSIAEIILEGKGEAMPISTNETKEGRKANRRATIEITWEAPIVLELLSPPDDDSEKAEITKPEPQIDTLYLSNETNRFRFPNNAHVVIRSKDGLEFTIKPNTFEAADTTMIEFVVEKEYMTPISIVEDQISTKSGENLLSSRGMFEYSVRVDGKEVQVKEGRDLPVKVPQNWCDGTFKIYGAEGVSAASNWQLTEVQTYLQTDDCFLDVAKLRVVNCDILIRGTLLLAKFQRKNGMYKPYCYDYRSQSITQGRHFKTKKLEKFGRKQIFNTISAINDTVTILQSIGNGTPIKTQVILTNKNSKVITRKKRSYLLLKKSFFREVDIYTQELPSFFATN